MCGRSIRRLTPAERADRDEAEGMLYDTLFAEIEAAERLEYEQQFGPEFRAKHPFTPDRVHNHEEAMMRLRQEQ